MITKINLVKILQGVENMTWHIATFNELSNDDLYQILKRRTDIFVVEQNCAYPELDNNDQKSTHYYLKKGEEIIAYARIIPKGSKYPVVSIGRVLVTEENRGHGYARELMVRVINFIKNEWNEQTIQIQAQEYLNDFYSSLGFKQISEPYLEDGIPHIDMLFEGN